MKWRRQMGWIKGGKAVGEYVLGTETLRALDIFSTKKITSMTNGINQRGKRWYVPGTLECNKHRNKSLMCQVSKLISRFLLKRTIWRIKRKIEKATWVWRGKRNEMYDIHAEDVKRKKYRDGKRYVFGFQRWWKRFR